MVLKPFPYQQEGVDWLVSVNGRGLLGDDPGLGKTGQVILALERLGGFPALIVCPTGAKFVWADEFAKWIEREITSCVIRKRSDVVDTAADVTIVSYGLVKDHARALHQVTFRAAVFDEAQALQSLDSQRTRFCVPFGIRAEHCIVVTGSPIYNRPRELAPILAAIRRKSLSANWLEYAFRYCGPRRVRIGFSPSANAPVYEWKFDGASNLPELHEKLKPILLRRRKRDVLKELPMLRRARVAVDAPELANDLPELRIKLRRLLRVCGGRVSDALFELKNRKLRGDSDASLGALSKAYEAAGLSKAETAVELTIESASIENPIIVYAHNKSVIEHIRSAVARSGLRVDVIHGGVSSKDRESIVAAFQGGDLDVIVLSITAAATAITLTRSSDMIVAQLPWSPETALQCEGRADRIGQQRGVLVRYLHAPGTIDDLILKLLERKCGIIGAILEGSKDAHAFQLPTVSDSAEESERDEWAILKAILDEEARAYSLAA